MNTLDLVPTSATSNEATEVFLWQKQPHTNQTSSYSYDAIKAALQRGEIAPRLSFFREFYENAAYRYTNSVVFQHEAGATGLLKSRTENGGRDIIYLRGNSEAVRAAQKDLGTLIASTGFEFEEVPAEQRRKSLQ
ncbi:hypothetical protein FJZ18_00380 [Candidatus Pacearchaeota archaeon]|nr:hypothetical protein [Candidatus Pacearchaeota archaeon]